MTKTLQKNKRGDKKMKMSELGQLAEFLPKEKFLNHPDNPLSKPEFSYLFRNRNNNGFAEAFVRINARKYLVNIPNFIKCLAER